MNLKELLVTLQKDTCVHIYKVKEFDNNRIELNESEKVCIWQVKFNTELLAPDLLSLEVAGVIAIRKDEIVVAVKCE